MSRMQHLIFGGLCAAFIGFAVPASAAPSGLAVTKLAPANQATLVRGGHGGGGWGHGGGGGGWGHGGGGGGWGHHGGGGWGHAGGGWGHGGGWRHGGGWGYRHRGYPYFAYWGGYPYYNDYYFDDYGYDYSDDTCYYSRRLRARVCPEY